MVLAWGGYAALYFGNYINSSIISFSPMLSIHPELMEKFPYKKNKPFVKRRKFEYSHSDLNKNNNNNNNVHIIYDELVKDDVFFIDRKIRPFFPVAKFYKLSNKFHVIPEIMLEAGILSRFVKSILNKTYDIDCNIDYSKTKISKIIKVKGLMESGQYYSCATLIKELIENNPKIEDFDLYRDFCLNAPAELAINKYVMPKKLKSKLTNNSKLKSNNYPEKEILLKNQVDLFVKILDFDSALAVSELGEKLYPEDSFFRRRRKMLSNILRRFEII